MVTASTALDSPGSFRSHAHTPWKLSLSSSWASAPFARGGTSVPARVRFLFELAFFLFIHFFFFFFKNPEDLDF